MEESFLEQTRGRKLDLIVCSDAEAILGIGDQGVGVHINSSFADMIIDTLFEGHRSTLHRPRTSLNRNSNTWLCQISVAKSVIYTYVPLILTPRKIH